MLDVTGSNVDLFCYKCKLYIQILQTAEKIFASFSCNDLHVYGKKQPLIIGQ